jgi:hypothetical protein
MMAAIFLLFAAIVGVVIGDAVLDNTGSGLVELFNRSFTDFTQGQLLVMAAGLGFLFALFLFLAWGSSSSRRARRRERRLMQRDLEGRLDEAHRENVDLRNELERTTRATRLSESGTTQMPEPTLTMRQREPVPDDRSVRNRLGRGDRVEEPVTPDR